MNLTLLKQAAEVAGLTHQNNPGLLRINDQLSVGLDHPMLPAYVASLLRTKVATEGAPRPIRFSSLLDAWAQEIDGPPEPEVGKFYEQACSILYYLTDAHFIGAAMVAFDEWDRPTAEAFVASCN